ncbi:MAG: bifunctional glutamate N-acetyltransferase/amino-acid acetyltransferase ArgJ [Rubripirellula sp.]
MSQTPSNSHSDDNRFRDLLPKGFRFAGVACGLKTSGKKDVALLVSDDPLVAGGVYTQNQIVAAPVVNCQSKTPSQAIRAVVANSGNANACTGEQGVEDAAAMCRSVAEHLGCTPDQVLVMSTGVIGVHLEMPKVQVGISQACSQLGSNADDFLMAADAICTTDQSRKVASSSFDIDGEAVRLVGMAKGAGMIAPNMATMLSVVITDVKMTAEQAQTMLKRACDASFNRISVDGHTSTNDTVLLLSSGATQVELNAQSESDFQAALNQLLQDLAKLIVLDGEGAKYMMAIEVKGAIDDDQAFEIAKTVAASPLVKTAITGSDPNWGRIVSAAGYAKAIIEPESTSLKICDETIYKNGKPVNFNAADLSSRMRASREVSLTLQVGTGEGKANYWSSDLTTAYVEFNSEYTT